MPAAAVIPAPVAYIKVVAVKKLVVRTRVRGRSRGPGAAAPSSVVDFGRPFAFPALSAGVDCHVHPPRGPAGENLCADDVRGRSGRSRVVLGKRAVGIRGRWRVCLRALSLSFLPVRPFSFPPSSRFCLLSLPSNVSSRARVCGRAVSPPRVLLTECPRRPVRSL